MSIKLNKLKKKKKIADNKCSTGDSRSESSLNKIEDLMGDHQCTVGEHDKSETNRSIITQQSEEKCNMQPRVEEHEYLQFLLRITEDIIINNLYTNEDIEKVFHTHVEANKDHLKVVKMEAQLARLCTELEIPYKNIKNNSRDSACYEQFFNSYAPDQNERTEDCECTTKRVLDIELKDNKIICENEQKEENSEFYLKKICKIIASKCSLDRVTECSEPSHSLDAIIGSMKQLSNTSVYDSRNILSYFMEISNKCSEEILHHSEIHLDTEEKIVSNDNLTEKEKLGCKEEEILFEKLNSTSISPIGDNNINATVNLSTENDISTNENDKQSAVYIPANVSIENLITRTIDQVKEKPDIILNSHVDRLVENFSTTSCKNIENCGQVCLNCDKVENTSETISSQKCNENETSCTANDILDTIQNNKEASSKVINECLNWPPVGNAEHCDEDSSSLLKCRENRVNNTNDMKENVNNIKEITLRWDNVQAAFAENSCKVTNDQSTQMEIAQSDKECNTSLILNDYHRNDYVLLNGPVYVLKTILDSSDKLIIYDQDNVGKNVGKEIDQPLHDEEVSPINYDRIPTLQIQPRLEYIPPYTQDDFSKLLNSDYDLMPQRDSDTSNKYHHLLVDATTSISNIDLNEAINNTFTNPDALLLSDKYELIGQFRKEENLIPETDNVKHSNFKRKDFHFEHSHCELQSTLLKEVNNLPNVSDSNKTETSSHIPNLDVPLTNYQSFSKDIIKENDVISKDLSESGEIVRACVCTDEELSQMSTFRSDRENNSSSLSPNHNILGKRKLKHPL
ncbi:MATH and LRR domain-containing protein PFE0570w-like isoform X2 [Anoplophora glabripennis]|nr:MATH and LRR domain-containing protein PFE0570w-like isoform X2 [Anoplophora glabripennis]